MDQIQIQTTDNYTSYDGADTKIKSKKNEINDFNR